MFIDYFEYKLYYRVLPQEKIGVGMKGKTRRSRKKLGLKKNPFSKLKARKMENVTFGDR